MTTLALAIVICGVVLIALAVDAAALLGWLRRSLEALTRRQGHDATDES
jgi:hypothetical protein